MTWLDSASSLWCHPPVRLANRSTLFYWFFLTGFMCFEPLVLHCLGEKYFSWNRFSNDTIFYFHKGRRLLCNRLSVNADHDPKVLYIPHNATNDMSSFVPGWSIFTHTVSSKTPSLEHQNTAEKWSSIITNNWKWPRLIASLYRKYWRSRPLFI